jgi:hypothetical protein
VAKRKRPKLTLRQRAAKRAAKTRASRRAFVEHSRAFFARVLKRQEAKAARRKRRKLTPRQRAARRAVQQRPLPRAAPRMAREAPQPLAAPTRRVEWEARVSYQTAHKNVQINWRIQRTDGQPMTRLQAEDAFAQIMLVGTVPSGVYLMGIDWQSGGKSHTYTDQDAFDEARGFALYNNLRLRIESEDRSL